MTPYALTAWCIIAAIFAAVVPYIIGKLALARKKDRLATSCEFGHFDAQIEEVRKIAKNPILAAPYGETGYPAKAKPAFGKRGVVVHDRKKSIFLTARQLEEVNVKRKLRGALPLNRTGLANAISHPWDRNNVQTPKTSDDWLAYLIMYECLWDHSHTSPTTAVETGVTITPDAPYNGHGGEFPGAGASGDWTSAGAQALAAAPLSMGVAGAVEADRGSDPAPAPDTSSSYTPDTSSSYTPDTSSSSFDSGSAVSFDPGTSTI